MQVFAQKSVLVVSIYFPLIALICTDIPCFRAIRARPWLVLSPTE